MTTDEAKGSLLSRYSDNLRKINDLRERVQNAVDLLGYILHEVGNVEDWKHEYIASIPRMIELYKEQDKLERELADAGLEKLIRP